MLFAWHFVFTAFSNANMAKWCWTYFFLMKKLHLWEVKGLFQGQQSHGTGVLRFNRALSTLSSQLWALFLLDIGLCSDWFSTQNILKVTLMDKRKSVLFCEMIMERTHTSGFKWDKQYENPSVLDSCWINVNVTGFQIGFEVAYCFLKAENLGWAANLREVVLVLPMRRNQSEV